MIAPPSLAPALQKAPFDCNILPPPYNDVCAAGKTKYAGVVAPDCSRLPPEYQPFCQALHPPIDPRANQWPNTAAANRVPPNPSWTAEQFLQARQHCAALGPRYFYSCLFQTTKYPYYPEFGPVPRGPCATLPLVNRDSFPCDLERVGNPFPTAERMEGGFVQVSPSTSCNSMFMPKTWSRK